jgi:transposase
VLVELNVVEQRYQAVLEVLNDGASVTDVARRHGVSRQTVHVWLRRYAADGLGGLADHSSKPLSCPHQMVPELEARIVEMRRAHPGWGPRTILFWLDRAGVSPLPGRSSVERCLIRHGLVTQHARKRKRSDYKRWERSRAMELWQMDIVGGVRIVDAKTSGWEMPRPFELGVAQRQADSFAAVDAVLVRSGGEAERAQGGAGEGADGEAGEELGRDAAPQGVDAAGDGGRVQGGAS